MFAGLTSPPPITVPPSNQVINLATNNYNLSLYCEATGASSYTWQKQDSSIPSNSVGVNTRTLSIINMQPENAGNYRCVASSECGASYSEYATITINGEVVCS